MIKKIIIYMVFISYISFANLSFASHTLYSDWMCEIPESKKLNQIIIPGTHDSGTYLISKNSPFSLQQDAPLPPWLEKISNFLPYSIVRTVVAHWSKTQPYSFKDQLENGSRYLDLRICYTETLKHKKDFYFCHTLLSDRVENGFQQIHDFAIKHPKEIILLDINHVYGIKNPGDQTKLVVMIEKFLGVLAISNKLNPTSTLNEIWKQPQNHSIIIMYNPAFTGIPEHEQSFVDSYIWSEANIQSDWANTPHIEVLKKFLDDQVNTRAKSTLLKFHVLQAILTEDTKTVIDGLISLNRKPSNVQQLAMPVNRQLPDWIDYYIRAYSKQPIVNIVIQDWFDLDNKAIIELAIKYDTEQ